MCGEMESLFWNGVGEQERIIRSLCIGSGCCSDESVLYGLGEFGERG